MTATRTKTETKTETERGNPMAELPIAKGEVAVFQAPRLPFHDAIKERFGIDRGSWKVLTEAIFPNAKSVDAIVLALSYCQSRKLDIFKRPVHIVPMWSSTAGEDGNGGYVETIWPSISELRTTAVRTSGYAGCDQAEFGPGTETEFKGRLREFDRRTGKKEWTDKVIKVKHPEWCRITLYRMVQGHRCAFVGPKVVWLESYATIGSSDLPNDMWQTRAEGQIEKCAEAAALRRAFPEEIGNALTAEEMEGRIMRDVTPVEHAPRRPSSSTPTPPDPDAPVPVDGEIMPPHSRSSVEQTDSAKQPPVSTGDKGAHGAQRAGKTAPVTGALIPLDDLMVRLEAFETKAELAAFVAHPNYEASIEALSDPDRRKFERAFEIIEGKLK